MAAICSVQFTRVKLLQIREKTAKFLTLSPAVAIGESLKKNKALLNERGYENAQTFALWLLAYSLWLMVILRQLQAISHKL